MSAKLAYYDAEKVRESASGRWLEVFFILAGNQLGQALKKPTKHVTCPVHGTSAKNGRGDGFRFFNDVVQSGGGVCATCGKFHDGFELLMWLKGWSFRESLNAVAEALHVAPEESAYPKMIAEKPMTRTSSANPKEAQLRVIKKVFQPPIVACQPALEKGTEKAPIPMLETTPERMAEIQLLQAKIAARSERSDTESKERIDRTWSESVSLESGMPAPLYHYLKMRGILPRKELITSGDNIRFHPALPYYGTKESEGDSTIHDGVLVGHFPALIAAIRDVSGEIVTLHRTYLAPTGQKAEVECPRKLMALPGNRTASGSAIQLGGFPKDGVLGIAEGIETAMSVIRYVKMPVWSCISATIMEKFVPPAGVHTVLVWTDNDVSLRGMEAAKVVKETLAAKGISVHILMPTFPGSWSKKSYDWNDVLLNHGISGFPTQEYIRHIVSYGASATRKLA